MTEENLPLTTSIEVGGALMGLTRGPAYLAAARGVLPCVTFGRRKLVLLAKLESLAGRRITLTDLRQAEAVVSERKISS